MAHVYASITHSEAQARARALEVRSYSVDLDLTRGDEVFGSTTVVRFAAREPGASTFAEIRPATLHRAVLNGRELDPADLRDGRLTLTDLAADNELHVVADMSYTHTGEGMHHFTDPADGESYVFTQCGPDEAARVFACFDQPDLKAVFEVSVTAPDHWIVLGNAAGTRRGGRWEFAPTPPISTYLAAVVAGPMHSVRTHHDGIPLGVHCRRSLAAHLDVEAEEILDLTRRSFDRYHELFEERYAFAKYDQVFVPEFNWGAVENPGCVTFNEEHVFRSAVTDVEREERAVVIAHELAHMWFGNLVTTRWWDDLWLNESFAEYMGYQVIGDTTRFTGTWTTFAIKRKPWGYDADQRSSTHAVAAQQIEDAAAALANFDGISYAKGASALRQLVAWIGEKAFLAGVNDYFARHRFGNAELADLVDALTRASGRDVHGWTLRWLRTSGVDTMRAEVVERDGTLESAAVVHGGDNASRPHRILVGAYDLRTGPRGVPRLVLRDRFEADLDADLGADLDTDHDADLGVSAGADPDGDGPAGSSPLVRTPLPRLVGATRPDLLLLNDGDLSYTKVRWDERSWQSVLAALSTVEDQLTRAVLWSTARDMVRDAALPPAEFLALVEAHLPTEPAVAIVEAVLAFSRHDIAGRYLAPRQRPAALARLADVCRDIIRRTTERPRDEGLRLAAVRGLIEACVAADDLGALRAWLGADLVPEGPALDHDLRWSILLRLATAGEVGETEFAAELARDNSAAGQVKAARCRAAVPDLAGKERAWLAMLDSDALSNELLAATADGFWQPDQAALTAGFVERYFVEVPAAADRGPTVARLLAASLFPAHVGTPETVRRAETCLADGDLAPAFRRVLTDQLDDLRRAVQIRSS